MRKRKLGRPSTCTAAILRKLCDALADGCSFRMDAARAGVNEATARGWCRSSADVREDVQFCKRWGAEAWAEMILYCGLHTREGKRLRWRYENIYADRRLRGRRYSGYYYDRV